jgi:predicted HicB family RNase H-like nuclease
MRRRSSKAEQARRLNTAFAGLQANGSLAQIVSQLMRAHGLSRRQAYRYVQQARHVQEPLPVPEDQAVLSVKLPRGLLELVRSQARAQGCTLQAWVDQALQQAVWPAQDYG